MLGTETEEDSLYVVWCTWTIRLVGHMLRGVSVQNYCILVLALD